MNLTAVRTTALILSLSASQDLLADINQSHLLDSALFWLPQNEILDVWKAVYHDLRYTKKEDAKLAADTITQIVKEALAQGRVLTHRGTSYSFWEVQSIFEAYGLRPINGDAHKASAAAILFKNSNPDTPVFA